MAENVKKIIVLGKQEEKNEVSELCLAWKMYFRKKEWEAEEYFIGLGAEQTLMEIAARDHVDMVICFNLAGFYIQMFGGDIFLNKLYCPIINIIWQPFKDEELEILNSRLNVTIVFFTNVQENVDRVKECIDFPPYIQYVADLQKVWEEIDLETVLLYGNDIK